MRKIFLIVATAALTMGTPQEAKAQAFLKKLKDKVEQKVDNAVGNAVSNVLGGKKKTTTTEQKVDAVSSATNVDESIFRYPAFIEDRMTTYFLRDYMGAQIDENAVPEKTMAEVMKDAPTFLNAEDMLSEEGRQKIAELETQAHMLLIGQMKYGNALGIKTAYATRDAAGTTRPQASEESKQVMNQFAGELMAYLQSKGVDFNNPDEKVMEALSMEFMASKLGIPASEIKKLESMTSEQGEAYMRAHYPNAVKKAEQMGLVKASKEFSAMDRDDDAYIALSEEVSALIKSQDMDFDEEVKKNEKLLAMMQDESVDVATRMLNYERSHMSEDEVALLALFNQIAAEWATSDTYAKVHEMETALSARLNKWMEDNNANYDWSFPAWWKEGRQEQNKLIRAWNLTQLERWNAQLKKCDRKEAYINQLIALEAKVEASKDKMEEYQYLSLKSRLNSCFSQMNIFLTLPFNLQECPQAEYVSEEDGTF